MKHIFILSIFMLSSIVGELCGVLGHGGGFHGGGGFRGGRASGFQGRQQRAFRGSGFRGIGGARGFRPTAGVARGFAGGQRFPTANFRAPSVARTGSATAGVAPGAIARGGWGAQFAPRTAAQSSIIRGKSYGPAAGAAGTQAGLANKLNPNSMFTGHRFAQNRTGDRLNAQRNFLSQNFRGHNWNWWWQNNPNVFYSAFPAAFYGAYGYYPPIYYDYYDAYGTYPTEETAGPIYPELLTAPSFDDCMQQCYNTTNLSEDECAAQCGQGFSS